MKNQHTVKLQSFIRTILNDLCYTIVSLSIAIKEFQFEFEKYQVISYNWSFIDDWHD